MKVKECAKIVLVFMLVLMLVVGCSQTKDSGQNNVNENNNETADNYPEGPIRVIIASSPGGGTDIMARLVFKYVEEKLGVPFVFEYHEGGGASVGYTELMMSKPDGYTIGQTNTTSIVTHELTREVPYTLKGSFQPAFQVVFDPSTIFVRADSPFKTAEELFDYARENPGKLSWGGTFEWGAHHVHLKKAQRATGTEFTYVPFDGAADSRAAILGGHIDVVAGGASEFVEHVKSGDLRALAVAADNRFPALPDTPTYKELGYDVNAGSNRGFSAPAGTPKERLEVIARAIEEVLQDSDFLVEAEKIGIKDTLEFKGVNEWEKYLHDLQEEMIIFMGN